MDTWTEDRDALANAELTAAITEAATSMSFAERLAATGRSTAHFDDSGELTIHLAGSSPVDT